MKKLHHDFESRSEFDLKAGGVYMYAQHPSTQPLCLAWKFDDGTSGLWRPDRHGWECPPELAAAAEDPEVMFCAHNAPFEYCLWNYTLKFWGWPSLGWERYDCTMSRAYAMSLPGSLEMACAAVGIEHGKDKTGHQLMMRLCKPARYENGQPVWLQDVPSFIFQGESITGEAALDRLCEYCEQDVRAEMALDGRLLPLSKQERRVWVADQRINERGIPFDMEAVNAAVELRDKTKERLTDEMAEVTGGEVAGPSKLEALKLWLWDHHLIHADSLDKEHLGKLLDDTELPKEALKALELRREYNRSTSLAKLDVIQRAASAKGRVKWCFQYHGAGTGRWAGRLLQPHNLTRDLPPPEVIAELMHNLKCFPDLIRDPIATLSKCLRGFIVAPGRHSLMGGDWSAVESVKLAWLAAERWKLDAYRACYKNPNLPDVYRQMYGRAFKVDPTIVDADQRQVGKVMDLAFGYEGGVGAYVTMAGAYGLELPPEDEIHELKDAWRRAHPKVAGDLGEPRKRRRGLWRDLERAAMQAVLSPGSVTPAGRIKFVVRGSFLFCRLPSKRMLCYPYPKVIDGEYGKMLTYKTVPSADDWKRGRIIEEAGQSRFWARVSTYGGKLAENVTQASCRDILAEAILACEDEDLAVIKHVHDELVAEGVFTEHDREKLTTIMNTPPRWAPDLPVKADVWLAKRYQK